MAPARDWNDTYHRPASPTSMFGGHRPTLRGTHRLLPPSFTITMVCKPRVFHSCRAVNPQAGPPLVSGYYSPSQLVNGEYLADSTWGLLAEGDNASFAMILHTISPTKDDACAHTYEQHRCPLPPTPRNRPFENFFCLWVFPLSRCPLT